MLLETSSWLVEIMVKDEASIGSYWLRHAVGKVGSDWAIGKGSRAASVVVDSRSGWVKGLLALVVKSLGLGSTRSVEVLDGGSTGSVRG